MVAGGISVMKHGTHYGIFNYQQAEMSGEFIGYFQAEEAVKQLYRCIIKEKQRHEQD